MYRLIPALILAVNLCLIDQSACAQSDFKNFDVSSIYEQLSHAQQVTRSDVLAPTWWDQHVVQSQRREVGPLATDVHSLMYLALKYSNQIRIASAEPLIRETAIAEADSNFDWVKYVDTAWNDDSEPISSILDAGATATRLIDQTFQSTLGVRRTNRYGGQVDLWNRIGWQDSNSTFFIPEYQASNQLTLSYSHPLMRGKGYAYNNSLVVLAQLEVQAAQDDFRAELQDHLLEVARAYWLLYQERSVLSQQVRLFLKTQEIVQILHTRQQIDAQRTQLITASAALETRRAELIRARTAVINAETRLRGLINAPELGNSDQLELVPVELPALEYTFTDLAMQIQTAVQNRPEARSAIQQVKAASTRLGIAQHEMLPVLNFVTETFVSGLRGSSNFGNAFLDQFENGRPSYSLGLQYEMPIGNRLACSRLQRRKIEMRRLQSEYDQALSAIQTEVDIAVRELKTAYREVSAKSRALLASEAEAETIRVRWSRMIDGNGNSALNLESLLRAQERVALSERDYVTSVLTYNLAMIHLKKTNGTLLQSRNVVVSQFCDDCEGPSMELDMFQPQSISPPNWSNSQMPPAEVYPQGFISEASSAPAPNTRNSMNGVASPQMMARQELEPSQPLAPESSAPEPSAVTRGRKPGPQVSEMAVLAEPFGNPTASSPKLPAKSPPSSRMLAPQLTGSSLIKPKAPLQKSVERKERSILQSTFWRRFGKKKDAVRTAAVEQDSQAKQPVATASMEVDLRAPSVKQPTQMQPLPPTGSLQTKFPEAQLPRVQLPPAQLPKTKAELEYDYFRK